jgi:dienelactone hydrolase
MRVILLFIFLSNICCGAENFLAPLFFEYHLIDTSRQEVYSHDQSHPFRELMMHVWLPCDAQKKQYPLILFSHGLGETYNGMTYTHLCKAIASRGYIVASVSHSYGCKDIQFPDGRIAHYNFLSRVTASKEITHLYDEEVELWVADMIFALNECERLFNFSCVAIVGHSLGGSTAIQMCRRDDRIKVAINLDGPLYGTDALVPFAKQMLFIFGSSVLPYQITNKGRVPMHPALLWRQYFNQAWLAPLNTFIVSLVNNNGHKITIDGIVHDTFTDYAFTSDPVIQRWLIDGAVAHCAITGYVCEFLDCYLKN